MSDNRSFGTAAEVRALDFLRAKGYTLLHTNYRYRKAEVDLIVRKENLIVCVEVKARSYLYYGDPASFVSKKKIKLLALAMDFYMQQMDPELEVRFDIISIHLNGKKWIIDHLEGAFEILE